VDVMPQNQRTRSGVVGDPEIEIPELALSEWPVTQEQFWGEPMKRLLVCVSR
jgi:hypothetical protein